MAMTGGDFLVGVRARTLVYVEAQRVDSAAGYGRYRYAERMAAETLYASCYAAMTRHLYGDLDALDAGRRGEWVDYLQSHQDDDGLFRDPAIFGEGWYADDPLWCGRPHLTCHVIIALTCLGAVAQKPLRWLMQFHAPGAIEDWLTARDWGERVGWTGNEVMNVGTLLQYARDFLSDDRAADTLGRMLEWLERNHLNADTGLWGARDTADPIGRSHAVQAAYHLWPLWTYDGRAVPHVERAVDSLLASQNPRGGFGWGVHNPDDGFNSSACEDIDSIEPLCRFVIVTDYRREDVVAALGRAVPWVLSNQNADGGYVFMRGQAFEYGHRFMRADRDVSAMFPTWFRTLALACLGRALPQSPVGVYPWHFCRCPGYQF